MTMTNPPPAPAVPEYPNTICELQEARRHIHLAMNHARAEGGASESLDLMFEHAASTIGASIEMLNHRTRGRRPQSGRGRGPAPPRPAGVTAMPDKPNPKPAAPAPEPTRRRTRRRARAPERARARAVSPGKGRWGRRLWCDATLPR